MPRYVALLVALALAVVPIGCGGSAPDFTLATLDGKNEYTKESFKGKVVMLDFWATWCGPCRVLRPTITEFAQMYGKRGLVVLGVTSEAPKVVSDFVAHEPLGYEAVIDRGERAARAYGATGFPTLVIIDRDGNIVYNQTGPDIKEVGNILGRMMPGN